VCELKPKRFLELVITNSFDRHGGSTINQYSNLDLLISVSEMLQR